MTNCGDQFDIEGGDVTQLAELSLDEPVLEGVRFDEDDDVEVLDGGGEQEQNIRVLMAIRKALEEQVMASPARELCILTTLARSDPPALEEALKRIKVIREMELSDSDDPKKNNPELFPLRLQLISDPSKRGQVLEARGDHLSNKKCFEDAAATYLCCTSLEKALKAYRACGNWRGVLTVAGIIKLGKEEVKQLAHELCEELQAVGKPGEAAKIALEYCGDANAGINLLVVQGIGRRR
ncbi:hypothetical protein C3L33_22884, partial [Rhododendron williamsianum]